MLGALRWDQRFERALMERCHLEHFAKNDKENIEMLRDILSKKMTSTLFFSGTEQQKDKVFALLDQIAFIKQTDVGRFLYQRATTDSSMMKLKKRFFKDLVSKEMKQGIKLQNTVNHYLMLAKEAFDKKSKSKHQVGKFIFLAMENLQALKDAVERSTGNFLKVKYKDATSLAKRATQEYLQLSENKLALKEKMINARFSKKHTISRIEEILSKEIASYLFFKADHSTKGLQINKMLTNLRTLRPRIYNLLQQDSVIKKMFERFNTLQKPREKGINRLPQIGEYIPKQLQVLVFGKEKAPAI